MLRHKYNIQPALGYEPQGEVLVERAGYRNTQTQVAEFMGAGIALLASRAKKYGDYFDYPDGKVPDYVQPDPTRSGNFDLADASQMGREVKARLKERERVLRLEAKAEAERAKLTLVTNTQAKNEAE